MIPTGAEGNPENSLHVNRYISGIFIFISHVNSLVGVLPFSEKGQKKYFVNVNVVSENLYFNGEEVGFPQSAYYILVTSKRQVLSVNP